MKVKFEDQMVQVVRYVSECDVEPIGEPVSRAQAMAEFKQVLREGGPKALAKFTLTDPATGLLTSWAF